MIVAMIQIIIIKQNKVDKMNETLLHLRWDGVFYLCGAVFRI